MAEPGQTDAEAAASGDQTSRPRSYRPTVFVWRPPALARASDWLVNVLRRELRQTQWVVDHPARSSEFILRGDVVVYLLTRDPAEQRKVLELSDRAARLVLVLVGGAEP